MFWQVPNNINFKTFKTYLIFWTNNMWKCLTCTFAHFIKNSKEIKKVLRNMEEILHLGRLICIWWFSCSFANKTCVMSYFNKQFKWHGRILHGVLSRSISLGNNWQTSFTYTGTPQYKLHAKAPTQQKIIYYIYICTYIYMN